MRKDDELVCFGSNEASFNPEKGCSCVIPLRKNSFCILFISSKRRGIFKLNFAALIHDSVGRF